MGTIRKRASGWEGRAVFGMVESADAQRLKPQILDPERRAEERA